MHKYTLFFLAALFVCGTWSNCPAEMESVATEPDSTAADSGSDKVYTREYNPHTCPLLTNGSAADADKVGNLYVYAVPYYHYTDQSNEMFGVDSVWGGAHVTLGTVNPESPPENFHEIITWLNAATDEKPSLPHIKKQFTTKSWNPGSVQIKDQDALSKNCKKADKPSDLSGYELRFPSATLHAIVTHINKETKYSWFHPEHGWSKDDPEFKWHITAVQDPSYLARHPKLQTLDELKAIVTHKNVPWRLALVQVGKDDKGVYLERLGQQGDINTKKTKNFIPEPTTLLLALLALAAAPLRVRCG